MITEYINAALQRAKFEIIDNEKPYYGEVPELEGVWATGKTLEECRQDLAEVIDGWLVVRLRRGLPIPPLGKQRVRELKRLVWGWNRAMFRFPLNTCPVHDTEPGMTFRN